MSHRLLVNPGSPQAWEIPLKPGPNRLGRAEGNDALVNHPSVSSRHCEIIIGNDGIVLRDLGSTNGTFVNRAPVTEIALQPGQHVQLGNVDMIFEGPLTVAAPTAAAAVVIPTPSVVPTTQSPGPLRVSISKPAAHAPAAPAVPAPEEPTEHLHLPPSPPAIGGGSLPPGAKPGSPCKSHPKTLARFFCPKCHKHFCELCVTTLPGAANKVCRACGVPLAALQVKITRASQKGFFASLPGALVYPFKGSGLLVLIVATLLFAALDYMSGGIFMILTKMLALGYLYTYMQNIIHATASEEAEMPELPGMDDLFSACFRFLGTVMLSFGIPIGCLIARIFFDADIPMALIIVTAALGCIYFPMSFLAVAMKDSIAAANPLVVIPAILKAPLQYLVAATFMIGVFGARWIGAYITGEMSGSTYSTRDMSTMFLMFGMRVFWALASVYLLTVSMRVLGLFYVDKKRELGWFSR